MPRVDLTDYEIATDPLPAVCVRCGAPATERVVHATRVIDGWRGAFQLVGVLVGFFFFPPLLAFALRYARPVEVRLPMCAADRDDRKWRERAERRVLLPAWTAAALVADAIIVIGGGADSACVLTWTVVIGAVVAATLLNRGQIGVARPGKTGLRLMNVHPAFVAAL